MSRWFFQFDELTKEIEKKLDTLTKNTDYLFMELLLKVQNDGLSNQSISRLEELYTNLKDTFERENGQYSLNHSIRIAALFWDLSKKKTYQTLALCLCHNLREAGKGQLKNIEIKYLNDKSIEAVKRLTIDRNQERSLKYLEEYYDNIDKMEADLMVLKGCDKLDNFLSYSIYNLEPYYYMVVNRFVVPRVESYQPQLSKYLANVASYVQTDLAKKNHKER
jgi:hypothetical protein